MSAKLIRIAALGMPHDYRASLVPLVVEYLGYRIQWTSAIRADLIIYGPFYDTNAPRLRYLPKAWRSKAGQLIDLVDGQLSKRMSRPIALFHTAENFRHDHISADFAISHDLNVPSDKHYRLPYWMEMIDWSHEGLVGNLNPRYGELIKLGRLQAPLGYHFLKRSQKAVLMTSHLREPRAMCLNALRKFMPVDGVGPYFNKEIKDHHCSGFLKKNILQRYAFNLCPENGIYSGYVTEKIPEAFAAGCLPISCVDESVDADFNPLALINLAPMIENNFEQLEGVLTSKEYLEQYANQPLITKIPNIFGLQKFIHNICKSAV